MIPGPREGKHKMKLNFLDQKVRNCFTKIMRPGQKNTGANLMELLMTKAERI